MLSAEKRKKLLFSHSHPPTSRVLCHSSLHFYYCSFCLSLSRSLPCRRPIEMLSIALVFEHILTMMAVVNWLVAVVMVFPYSYHSYRTYALIAKNFIKSCHHLCRYPLPLPLTTPATECEWNAKENMLKTFRGHVFIHFLQFNFLTWLISFQFSVANKLLHQFVVSDSFNKTNERTTPRHAMPFIHIIPYFHFPLKNHWSWVSEMELYTIWNKTNREKTHAYKSIHTLIVQRRRRQQK